MSNNHIAFRYIYFTYNHALIFVLLKFGGVYYCDLLLSQQLLPAIPYRSLASSYFCKTVPGHAVVSYIRISQGSVATRLRCVGIFNGFFVANFLLSVMVKEL